MCCRRNLDKRVPEFQGIEFAESWAGVIDTMPDIVPVMAKMVAGDQPEHDLSRFRFGRFTDGSKMKPCPAL